MKFKSIPLTLALILAIFSGTIAQNVKRYPVEDFFRNPDKMYYQISPDGKHVAHCEPYQKRMNVVIQKIYGSLGKRVTNSTERNVSEYFWKGDTIIYSLDKGGDENFHFYSVDIEGNNQKDLTPFDSVMVKLVDVLKNHETDVIIKMNKRSKEAFDAYRLNVITGELTLLAENPGNIINWITDHEGKLRAAQTSDGANTTLLYRSTESEPFKPVITTNFKEGLRPQFFTSDNKNLYALSNMGRDKYALVTFDLSTGKEIEKIYEHPEYDVQGAVYSTKRKVLTEVYYQSDKYQKVFFDNKSQRIKKRIDKKLPNHRTYISSWDAKEEVCIVNAFSDLKQELIYKYDVKADRLVLLADMYPWIQESDMAEMKPITYQSRDGLTIHGYLTLPKGQSAENLPVIVNPHGGPWGRNEWRYDQEVQFLANRGYAVLQMNFRGSTGYGRKFYEASFKEWGKKMQDDITDGVEWLIKHKIADPKRIGIYGASYGGYATLAGLTFTPDLYACGVDYVGISNIFTLLNTVPPYWKPVLDMMQEMIGDPEKDSLLLRETSPFFHADKIKVPLFVAQGANDPRVKKSDTDQIVEALKNRGVEVPYMVKDNEGHGFHNEENKMEFYNYMENFLEKHLHPDQANNTLSE